MSSFAAAGKAPDHEASAAAETEDERGALLPGAVQQLVGSQHNQLDKSMSRELYRMKQFLNLPMSVSAALQHHPTGKVRLPSASCHGSTMYTPFNTSSATATTHKLVPGYIFCNMDYYTGVNSHLVVIHCEDWMKPVQAPQSWLEVALNV